MDMKFEQSHHHQLPNSELYCIVFQQRNQVDYLNFHFELKKFGTHKMCSNMNSIIKNQKITVIRLYKRGCHLYLGFDNSDVFNWQIDSSTLLNVSI